MVARGVYLVEVDEDRYGRLVGHLFHSKEGYDINASMVCAGYAWWYERYAPDSQALSNCQVEAQQAPEGLWEDEDPMPPWKWRRKLIRLTTSDVPTHDQLDHPCQTRGLSMALFRPSAPAVRI